MVSIRAECRDFDREAFEFRALLFPDVAHFQFPFSIRGDAPERRREVFVFSDEIVALLFRVF